MTDDRLFYAATERNRDPILTVLTRVVPEGAVVLEAASGSGEHAVYFAPRLPSVTWIASDIDERTAASVAAWAEHLGVGNVEHLRLDVEDQPWPIDRGVDVLFCANLIHIAPWSACLGLLRGAGAVLNPNGALVLYGPYQRDGRHTAPSNETFDRSLRDRNASWGVRELETVSEAAAEHGLMLEETVTMPANNLSVILRRQTTSQVD